MATTLQAAVTAATNQIEQSRQSPKDLESSEKPLALKDDQPGKNRVGEAILIFHDALKTYGKEPEQMESVTKLFLFALADYPVAKVIDAMSYYIKYFNEFPAPADIVNIIERGNKPPFSQAVYVSINKKYPEDRTDEEWLYLREYERWNLKG